MLLLISISLLIAPSLFHQIIFGGESRPGATGTATMLAGASLLPLTIGLGVSAFVTFEHLFGRTVGIVAGTSFAVIGLAFLYGLGFALKRNRTKQMPEMSSKTPLKTKVEQMLTEARVIIPGGQALLGFQLVATLTRRSTSCPPFQIYPLRRTLRRRAFSRPFDEARSSAPPRL